MPAVDDEAPALRLHAERSGRGPRLVLVHGFTQTGRSWAPVAGALEADHEVVRVDAPGHGRSSDVMAGLRSGARLIADEGGEGTYVGYSMGGRFALHVALAHPELVRGLVLLGATAGIEDPAERAERVTVDEGMAARLERDGVERFLDDWLSLPLFARLPREAAGVEARRENTVEGLASSLRLAGTGAQDPLWSKLGRIEAPTLVLAGEQDEKFAALAERLASSIGANATMALVPGAGHAAHLEQPDAFLSILRPWLADHEL